jgi:hypothetical protein
VLSRLRGMVNSVPDPYILQNASAKTRAVRSGDSQRTRISASIREQSAIIRENCAAFFETLHDRDSPARRSHGSAHAAMTGAVLASHRLHFSWH